MTLTPLDTQTIETHSVNEQPISGADASFTVLEGKSMRLRRFEMKDAEIFQKYRDDPSVSAYQSWDRFSLENAHSFIREMANTHPNAPNQWFQFAVEAKASGQMVGDVALGPWRDDPSQASVGFTIAPAYQRKGYALEALQVLLDYAFGRLGKHRIVAEVDPRNAASENLLLKAGFRLEGHCIQDLWFKGAWADTRLFAMLGQEHSDRSIATRSSTDIAGTRMTS